MKKVIVIFLSCLVLAVGGVTVYKYCFSDNMSTESESNMEPIESEYEEIETIAPIDAEAYLNEIGEIQNKTDASSSDAVLTEGEVLALLAERGFEGCVVQTNYNLDGVYQDAMEVNTNATVKHPIYETYYVGSDDFVWSITIVNGKIYANPLSYNFQENMSALVVLSETEYMTVYDNVTNQFFEVMPDASQIMLKNITRIDAALLQSLTIEGINQL